MINTHKWLSGLACAGALLAIGAVASAEQTLTVAMNGQFKGLDDAIKAFSQIHPDVKFNLIYQAGLLDDPNHPYSAKVLSMVAGGVAPDVVEVAGQDVPQYAVQGILRPLDDFLAADGLKSDAFIPPAWQQTRWDGHTYAMTLWVDPNFALIWNKSLFAGAGLDPEHGPVTLAEYESVMKKLTLKDPSGKVTQIGAQPWDVYGRANTLFTWGWVFGGQFFDFDHNKVTAADPHVVEAATWVRDLYRQYAGKIAVGNFNDGHEGMRFLLAGSARDAATKANFEIGYGYEPYKEGVAQPNPAWIGGFAAAITKESKQPQLAWEFLKFISADKTGTQALAGGSYLVPAYLPSPVFQQYHDDPLMQQYLNIAQSARYQRPAMPVIGDYQAALDAAFGDVLSGKKQPQDALEFVQNQIQTKLDAVLKG